MFFFKHFSLWRSPPTKMSTFFRLTYNYQLVPFLGLQFHCKLLTNYYFNVMDFFPVRRNMLCWTAFIMNQSDLCFCFFYLVQTFFNFLYWFPIFSVLVEIATIRISPKSTSETDKYNREITAQESSRFVKPYLESK